MPALFGSTTHMTLTQRARRRLLLLCIILLLIIVAGISAVYARRAYRDHLAVEARDRGIAAFKEQKYDEAISELSIYRSRYPGDVESLRMLGTAHRYVYLPGNENLRRAAQIHEEITDRSPGDIEALEVLLEIYKQMAYRAELAKVLDELIEADPDNIKAHQYRAMLWFSQGRWTAAQEAIDRLVQLEPLNIDWRLFQFRILTSRGLTVPEQLEVIDEWSELESPDGRFDFIRANILWQLGRPSEARAAMELAVQRGLEDPRLLISMIDLLDLMQMEQLSEQVLALAERDMSDAQLSDLLIRRHWHRQNTTEARRALERASLELGSEHPVVLRWNAYFQLLDESPGIESTLTSLHRAPVDEGYPEQYNRIISAAIDARSRINEPPRSERIDTISRALALSASTLSSVEQPAAGTSWIPSMLDYFLGEAAEAIGDPDTAIRHYQQAWDRENQNWMLPGVRLARLYNRLQQPEDAYRVSMRILASSPSSLPAYIELVRARVLLMRVGSYSNTIDQKMMVPEILLAELERLIQQDGEMSLLESLYTEMLLGLGRNEAFIEYVDRLIQQDGVEPELLRDVAMQALAVDPELSRRILLRLGSLDTPVEGIEDLEVSMLMNDGRHEQAIAVILGEQTGEADLDTRMSLIRYASMADLEQTPGYILELMEAAPRDEAVIAFIANLDRTWSDRELASKLMERVAEVFGADSALYALCNARWVRAYDSGDQSRIASAITLLDKNVLRDSPDSLKGLERLSSLLRLLEPPDHLAAARALKKAVDSHPGNEVIYPPLISLLQETGDFQTAESYLRQYARVSGSDPGLKRHQADLLLSQGDLQGALELLRSIAEATGSQVDLLALAELLVRNGRFQEAEQTYRTILQLEDVQEMAVARATRFLAANGRLQESLELANDPALLEDTAQRAALIAELEFRWGSREHARDAISRSLDSGNRSARLHQLSGQIQLAEGNVDEAIVQFRNALEINPLDDESVVQLVSLLMLRSDSRAEVQELMDGMEQRLPAFVAMMSLLEGLSTEDGSFQVSDGALSEAMDLVERYPRFLQGWKLAVELHESAGRDGRALELARRCSYRMPSQPEPHEWITEQLIAQGAGADEILSAAMQWRQRSLDDPIRPDMIIANQYRILGRHEQALDSITPHAARIRRDLREHPDRVENLARIHLYAGDPQRAHQLIAPIIDSGGVLARWFRSIKPVSYEDAEQTLMLLEEEVGINDNTRVMFANEWLVLGRWNDRQEAVDHAIELIQPLLAREGSMSPELSRVVKLIHASALRASGRPDEAIVIYESILSNASVASTEAQELPARERARRRQERDHLVIAMNNLAELLMEQEDDRVRSLDMVDRAIGLAPSSDQLKDTRCSILMQLGRLEEAEQLSDSLVRSDPTNASFLVTRAAIDAETGRYAEAMRRLDRAEDLVLGSGYMDKLLMKRIHSLREEIEQMQVSTG
ncbi:MAG: hypothetical protein CMJ32_01980 [Phycisphaerae bacterium]|nr:hypothetical protein [Phycisphaerae bacterium]